MSKYLVLWELNRERIPIDPKERATAWSAFIGLIKEDIEKGVAKDWGSFVGEAGGYSVIEGTEVEVATYLQRFVPYVGFKTHAIASVNQIEEMIASMSK